MGRHSVVLNVGYGRRETWATTSPMTEVCAGEERRKHIRYPCAGEALVRQRGSDVSLEGQLSDISLGGCYLDMMNPLSSETEVELTVRVGLREIRGRGRVRASRQGLGWELRLPRCARRTRVP